MDQNQIIFQTINDVDEFVAKFSDKISADDIDKMNEYKKQIKSAVDIGDLNTAQDFCVKSIWFMQDFEINSINKDQEVEEKMLLSDLMNQTSNIANNSSVKDGKITENKSSWLKNVYYKYFYKWWVDKNEFDDNKFVFDIFDNIYQLLLLSCIVMIISFIIDNYFYSRVLNYYNIYTIWRFAFAVWLCKITKTSSNISIIIDIFILWCFAFGFWYTKLFFALS